MSDLHNWKVAVDQCHQKHIGPPPALHRRIAYLEAHRWAPRATSPVSSRARLKGFLRRIWRRET
jgi:predicted ATPase